MKRKIMSVLTRLYHCFFFFFFFFFPSFFIFSSLLFTFEIGQIWFCGVASFFGYLCIGTELIHKFNTIGYLVIANLFCSHWSISGMLAALAVPTAGSDDLLKNLGSSTYPVITIIASYIFSLGVIAPGIPVW